RMSGRLLKGRSDAVLITRALKLLYKERPDIDYWFIVSGDRDLNALCKAIKDEDKHVYLVAGDRSLANELRDSPYLRDDVFLLEDLIPQARWTRPGLRADDTQADKPLLAAEPLRRLRRPLVRGRAVRSEPHVPPVVPTAAPESEKEQRRLAVLLLDQLVGLHARAMPRGRVVTSVVALSQDAADAPGDPLQHRGGTWRDRDRAGRAGRKADHHVLARGGPPAGRLRAAAGRVGRASLQLRRVDPPEGRADRLGEPGALRGAPVARRGRRAPIHQAARGLTREHALG